MSDISLYRKYRPQNFSNLVGQDNIRDTLLNAFQENAISHAYLFGGPRGTGKTSTARLVAKTLNCLNRQKDGNPCEKCEICLACQEGKLMDLIEIDAASNRGIDEIRDLREKIKFAPTQAAKKIYIIDEVHMLTKEAFNALLKTLEEPPAHAHFILATTEVHKIPETIISRCQRFDFKRIDDRVITDRLKTIAGAEQINANEEALSLIAKNVQGGLRDAIGIFEQLQKGKELTLIETVKGLGIVANTTVKKIYTLIQKKAAADAIKEINELYINGYDLTQFSREMLEYLREELIKEVSGNNQHSIKSILTIVDHFIIAQNNLKNSSLPQLPLEIAIIKSCLPKEEIPNIEKESFISKIKGALKTTASTTKEKEIIPEIIREHQPLDTTKTIEQSLSMPLSLQNIKSNYSRILEHIKTPSIRRSFQEGKLKSIEDNLIHFDFSSHFHLEKSNSVLGKSEISAALEEIFQQKVKIECHFQEIILDPEIKENKLTFAGKNKPRQNEAPINSTKSTVNKAIEIFGGEIIE